MGIKCDIKHMKADMMNNEIVAEIFKKYNRWAFKFLLSKKYTLEETEDLVQKTYLSLLKNKDLKKETAAKLFSTSIALTAKSAKNRIRQRYSNSVPESSAAQTVTAMELLMRKRDLEAFNKAFSGLPPKAQAGLTNRLDEISGRKSSNSWYAATLLRDNKKLKKSLNFIDLTDITVMESLDEDSSYF